MPLGLPFQRRAPLGHALPSGQAEIVLPKSCTCQPVECDGVRVGARHQRVAHVKSAVVLGSTRPGRNGQAVAIWAYDIASKRGDADFELVDIADYGLPLLDEPVPPAMGQYGNPHTKRWAAKIAEFDGYVFVTPEYNHSTFAALKKRAGYLYAEWNNKAAGTRSVEQLRLMMAELQVATVRGQVALSLFTDFENFSSFHPAAQHEPAVTTMPDQVIAWSQAMKSVREQAQMGHMYRW